MRDRAQVRHPTCAAAPKGHCRPGESPHGPGLPAVAAVLVAALLPFVPAHAADLPWHDGLPSISLAPSNCAQAAEAPSLLRNGDGPTLPAQSSLSLSQQFANLSPRGRGFRASLVELPREHIPGQYRRPHYALGVRSTRFERWMDGMGMEAQICLAPVLRLRTKLSSEGDLHGALWIYARCSLR